MIGMGRMNLWKNNCIDTNNLGKCHLAYTRNSIKHNL